MNPLLFSTVFTEMSACTTNSSSGTEVVEEVVTSLTLGISDGAVDNAAEVNIFVSEVSVRDAGGNTESYPTVDANGDPIVINLLDFQGSDAHTLINGWELTEGEYQWIRMELVNGDATDLNNGILMSSYVVLDDGEIVPLSVKRGGNNGNNANNGVGEIQLNGLSLNVGENNFVVEFDLNKSLVNPQNSDEINLKPTGVRLQNTAESGNVFGSIDTVVIDDCELVYTDFANSEGEFSHVVYLYDDGVTVETAEDVNDVGVNTPVATAPLYYNATTGEYDYEIGFVAEGDYALGYTCLAHLDDPETEELIDLHGFEESVVIIAGSDTEANITEALVVEEIETAE